ncbi:MAG: TolC family protein [Betaproteobacteria bacterium]|nr:MAG: TolC family protein [Betaproteobacteria bacterium]
MRHLLWLIAMAFTAAFVAASVAAAPLTLDAVLAELDAPHPEVRGQTALLALSQAEREVAEGLSDLRVTLEAGLRGGSNPVTDRFTADNLLRLNVRKTVLDTGLLAAGSLAAREEQAAAVLYWADFRAQRRIALMSRFFDVVLNDMDYAAINEFAAVAFVRWDNAKERHRVGQISSPQLAEVEGAYQGWRVRTNDTQRRGREKRALLANAMNRPGDLPSEVVDPALPMNDRVLPSFDDMLLKLNANNPRLAALRLQLEAARQRIHGVRASDGPRLEWEAEVGAYSRDSSTRDTARTGLNLVWPISQGRRFDGEMAREQARLSRLQADYDLAAMTLRQSLYEVLQEVVFLRDIERKAVLIQSQQHDLALERARAEYDLEMKSNLGDSMAETQRAQMRQRSVEYRLALALARLDALLGVAPGHKEK